MGAGGPLSAFLCPHVSSVGISFRNSNVHCCFYCDILSEACCLVCPCPSTVGSFLHVTPEADLDCISNIELAMN